MPDQLRRSLALLAVGRRIDPRLTRELIVATLATNVGLALRALWFKLGVDAVVDGDLAMVTAWAVALAVSDALRSVALVRSQMSRMDLQDRAVQWYQQQSMRLAGAAPGIGHFEDAAYLDELEQYRKQLPTVSGALGSLTDAAALVLRAIVTLALLATVSPVLLLLPLFVLPALWVGRRAQVAVQRGESEAASHDRRAEHLYGLLTDPKSAKEVRVFGLGDELRRRDRTLWATVTRIRAAALTRSHLTSLAGWFVFAIGYVGSVLLVAAEAAAGQATAGDLLLTVILAGQVNLIVQQGADLVGLMTAVVHAEGLERRLAATGERRPTGLTPAPGRLHEGITFTDVTFRYPGSATPSLHHVDLHLPAGSTVALVGENGAGKTSLVKLMCGLYPVGEGRLTVDGVDMAELDQVSWRGRIAAAFQDFVNFEVLAREAVGLGDLPRLDDEEAVERAIGRAAADDVIARLPSGLDTQLGTQFDGGVDLSGGQWQRLALARAMMREHPLLLVLDEPTAALDATAEHALFERYSQAARRTAQESGAITVLVSHRFSTVRMADLIVVVEGGAITEKGTHGELMRRGGTYAELYGLQAASYR